MGNLKRALWCFLFFCFDFFVVVVVFGLVHSGSQTLHHWQQLAQPNLGTILDPRPGVITKGFTQLPKDAIYHLSDLEEDEEEGITFQVEQKPSVSKPVTGIFLPAITSAGGPVTGKNSAWWGVSGNSAF